MSVTIVPEEASRVSTITDLKNLPTSSSRVVDVEGYNSSGDGGGGTFVWKSGASQGLSDDGIYFQSNKDSNGIWKRVIESERKVNVRWFGATGDGETDDTSALSSVWSHINSKNGGVITAPAGDYVVQSELLFNGSNGLILDGFGYKNTTFISQNQSNAFKFLNGNGIEIRNISTRGESGNQGILSGFRFKSCSNVVLTNCFGEKAGSNFNFTNCERVSLMNCETGEIISRSQPTSIPQGKGLISDNSSIRIQNFSFNNDIPSADVSEIQNGGEIIVLDRKLFINTTGPFGGEDGDVFYVIESN